jgi:hypothetical protein
MDLINGGEIDQSLMKQRHLASSSTILARKSAIYTPCLDDTSRYLTYAVKISTLDRESN